MSGPPRPGDIPEGPFDDGLDEARRGLWRSAAESFGLAAEAIPWHPAPPLARAVCQLARGDARGACVTLETTACLERPADDPWGARARWLNVAAREAVGDPLTAERLAEALPKAIRLRALAHLWLRAGRHQAGVEALLLSRGFRPDRPRGDAG